eukprot:RCo013051
MNRFCAASLWAAAAVAVAAFGVTPLAAAETAVLCGASPLPVLPLMQAWVPQFSQANPATTLQLGLNTNLGVTAFPNLDFTVTLDPGTASPGTLLVPFTVVPVVITYNIPNMTSPLNLSRSLLVDIWAGRVTTLSDPTLKALNPGLSATSPITVVVPPGSSALTQAFTSALSTFSSSWKAQFGTFMDSSGFAASAATIVYSSSVAGIPYAVSYVPLLEVVTQALPFARLQNIYGVLTFPLPSPITDGLNSVYPNSNFTASVVDMPELAAYPMLALAYFHVRLQGKSCAQQQRLFDFLNWVLVGATAASTALSLGYFPLPPHLTSFSLVRLTNALTCTDDSSGGAHLVRLVQ